MPSTISWGAVAAVLLAWPAHLHAQARPSATIPTPFRDSLVATLRAEFEAEGFKFAKVDRRRALFTMDAGQMPVRGQYAPVTLETTVHIDSTPNGFTLTVSEELIATLGSFQERRHPDPRDRAQAYLALFAQMEARLAPPASRADSVPGL